MVCFDFMRLEYFYYNEDTMVKKHFTLAIAAAMLSLSTHAASIHDDFPVTGSVTVEGRVADADFNVDMPFHTTGTTTMIVGTGNAKTSKRFISGDFEPVVVPTCDGTPSNMTYSTFYAQDVRTSPVGAYEETLVGILVKRKGAPELSLSCLDANPDQSVFLNHLLDTLGVLGAANTSNIQAGLPNDYGFYFPHLLLDNPKAVDAGVQIWGYPKQLADVNFDITDEVFNISVKKYKHEVINVSYQRGVGFQMPLASWGDNILPAFMNPSPDTKLSQHLGILSTAEGTNAWVQPFIGEFDVNNPMSTISSRFLRFTDFTPKAVVEFTEVEGVALPLYSAN